MLKKEIHMDGKLVGQAHITVDGLYAQVRCRCDLPGDKIFAVYIKDYDDSRLLGTCVPANRGYILVAKVPKKYIMKDNIVIYVAEKYVDASIKEFCLIPGEPIETITDLDRCIFRLSNGKACLFLQEKDSKLCVVNSRNS